MPRLGTPRARHCHALFVFQRIWQVHYCTSYLCSSKKLGRDEFGPGHLRWNSSRLELSDVLGWLILLAGFVMYSWINSLLLIARVPNLMNWLCQRHCGFQAVAGTCWDSNLWDLSTFQTLIALDSHLTQNWLSLALLLPEVLGKVRREGK